MARRINQTGLDLIKDFESFRADAYLCPANVWTIGYGHTKGVASGQKVTKAQAEKLLREDLAGAQAAVERCIAVPLTDNQFTALVSFAFNVGAEALKTSTLRQKLNLEDYDAVPSELGRWVKAGGKTLTGLVRRRAAEAELFLRPDGAAAGDDLAMPQRVETADDNRARAGYLVDDLVLERGHVDDRGDARYVRLSQNVPDGYVCGLQNDLRILGFAEAEEPDGAFGRDTKQAVEAFQKAARIAQTGRVDRATKDAILAWLEEGHSKADPPGGEAAPAASAPAGITLVTPRVPHFSQGDPRWAERVLGKGSTIRKEGCAISCIAMILSYYGRSVTPETVDQFLDDNQGYSGNSVVWSVAGRCGEAKGLAKLAYGRKEGDPSEVADVLRDRIGNNLLTMVRVDYGVDDNIRYDHFVLCVGDDTGRGFIMNDPATSAGDGYGKLDDENIIQMTTRKSGYNVVQLDYYDPK